jgi:predicted nucleic-acid-binding Zn-ribbon protein
MKTKFLTTAFVLIFSCTFAFAQDKTKSSEKQTSTTKMEMAKDSVYYTCSMHPEVKMDKPGKCPKCGMTLEKKTVKMTQTKSKNMEAMKTYTCSMHPEVKSDKPGKCPKCGMDLIEKK